MNIIKNALKIIPDSIYISMIYYRHFQKIPNLKEPVTMNEKIQWLKLHDRRPEYVEIVDKIKAKEYVSNIIGEEYIIPTLGTWGKGEDIEFDRLPDRFVLKTNHDSHGIIICRDKSKLDRNLTISFFNRRLKNNGFWYGREWPYKPVKPRILAEKYLSDSDDGLALNDYKFYCFGNKVDSVMICTDRAIGSPKFYFFDRDWKLKRYNKRGKAAPDGFTLPKPEAIDEMFRIAEVLAGAVNAPLLRVDLYSVKGRIYFGELTLYPTSGFDDNIVPEADQYLGSLVDINIGK